MAVTALPARCGRFGGDRTDGRGFDVYLDSSAATQKHNRTGISAMLAYVFWHRPYANADRARYEAGIQHFQAQLTKERPQGFFSAASFRIEAVPWLGDQPGYEDWCLLAGSWALDPLNVLAVAGNMKAPHDDVAAMMEQGTGGIYALAGGETPPPARSSVYWLTRPRSIDWRAALDPVRAKCPQANVWRRQMVLGVPAEFAVEAPNDTEIDVPAGWQSRRVRRIRVGGP
jgi:hypothetical protein